MVLTMVYTYFIWLHAVSQNLSNLATVAVYRKEQLLWY